MNVRNVFPSKWLSADDLGQRRVEVVIAGCTMEEVHNRVTNQKEKKLAVAFEKATKRLLVNKTQAFAMAEIAGVLKTQGFKPELSPEGITKFTRGTARIDLLAPEGMGGDVPTVDAGPRAPDLALPAGLAATPPTGGAR